MSTDILAHARTDVRERTADVTDVVRAWEARTPGALATPAA